MNPIGFTIFRNEYTFSFSFNLKATDIYLTTSHHVLRISTSGLGCGQYVGRHDCLSACNPYCSWSKDKSRCESTDASSLPTGTAKMDHTNMWSCVEQQRNTLRQSVQNSTLRYWWSTIQQKTSPDTPVKPIQCSQLSGIVGENKKQQNLTCLCTPTEESIQSGQLKIAVTDCFSKWDNGTRSSREKHCFSMRLSAGSYQSMY